MFKKGLVLIVLLGVLSLSAGCYTHNHIIGQGAQSNTELSEKQWYILFGLVPLNNVNSAVMAGNATDYQITTSHTFVDVLIGIVTGFVTVYPKTVTVKK